MAQTPKPIRHWRRRIDRAAAQRFAAMQTPESKAGVRALFAAAPADLGQAAVKGARGRRLPPSFLLSGPGPSAADLILEDRDAPRLDGAVGRELLPQDEVGLERLEAWNSEEAYLAARGITSEELAEGLPKPETGGEEVHVDAKTRARFEAAGWTVGSTQSFLGLSFEDMALLQDGASQAEAAARMPALQKLLTSPSCFPDPDPAESIRDIVSLVETWRMNPHLGDPFGDSE